MNPRIVQDLIASIIDEKVQKLKNRGIIVADYDELVQRLTRIGYLESEIRQAIIELRNSNSIKIGRFSDGRGWLRELRQIDMADEDNSIK